MVYRVLHLEELAITASCIVVLRGDRVHSSATAQLLQHLLCDHIAHSAVLDAAGGSGGAPISGIVFVATATVRCTQLN